MFKINRLPVGPRKVNKQLRLSTYCILDDTEWDRITRSYRKLRDVYSPGESRRIILEGLTLGLRGEIDWQWWLGQH